MPIHQPDLSDHEENCDCAFCIAIRKTEASKADCKDRMSLEEKSSLTFLVVLASMLGSGLGVLALAMLAKLLGVKP